MECSGGLGSYRQTPVDLLGSQSCKPGDDASRAWMGGEASFNAKRRNNTGHSTWTYSRCKHPGTPRPDAALGPEG